jgi:nucleoside-diphosphate-sugar epimerase
MSSVLVTGASGFLGSAIVTRLLEAGHRVTALSRLPVANEEVPRIAVDLTDAEATRTALTPFSWDAVVHAAGPAPKAEQTWADSVDTINAHVRMALHLTAAVPATWEGRFVHVSGMIVYGIPSRLPVKEDDPRRPIHAYGLAKSLADDVVLGSRLRDRWVLRLGGLFSESRRSGALFAFARAASHGKPLSVTTSARPVPWEILHVDDAAASVLSALSSPALDPGAVNVGYGEPIQLRAIAERIARKGGKGSSVVAEGPESPVFELDITKLRDLFAWPPATLEARLDRLLAAALEERT